MENRHIGVLEKSVSNRKVIPARQHSSTPSLHFGFFNAAAGVAELA